MYHSSTLLLFFGMLFTSVSYGQVVNSHAKVPPLAEPLSLSNVNEAADTFEDDEWVVLMQVQNNVIGTATNTAGFGNIGTIASAGLLEVR
jgi:hypothetical protein